LQRVNASIRTPYEVHLPGALQRAVALANTYQILPHYRFFTPLPVGIDVHIVYRDVRGRRDAERLAREHWGEGTLGYYKGYPGVLGGAPGLGLAAAQWLASKRVACVGADN
jgi:hypothetical protein